jgi:hypothetical protein
MVREILKPHEEGRLTHERRPLRTGALKHIEMCPDSMSQSPVSGNYLNSKNDRKQHLLGADQRWPSGMRKFAGPQWLQ